MKKLLVDPSSETPIYQQIVDQIIFMIATGDLQPGDQLPTVRAVAQETRINFNTVSRAYRILDDTGVISTQQGRGTYITDNVTSWDDQTIKIEIIHDLIKDLIHKSSQLGFTKEEIIELIKKEEK